MFNKINILPIIKKHLSTLKDFGTSKYLISDFILFFVFPIIVAFVFLIGTGGDISSLTLILIALYSISCQSLLNTALNTILLLPKDETDPSRDPKLKLRMFEETTSNIMFSHLVGYTLLLSVVLYSIFSDEILSFIVFYSTTLLTLLILMVLKRTFFIFINEFKSKDVN